MTDNTMDVKDKKSILINQTYYEYGDNEGQIVDVGVFQRPKNVGSRVALLPGKFLRVRKVFARITKKNL